MEPIKDFHLISIDFLKLIAQERANNNTKRADFLENYYDSLLIIITRSSEELHIQKLQHVNSHLKEKLLEAELKDVYNNLFKTNSKLAIEYITKSHLPTKGEIAQPVPFKTTEAK